MVNKKKSEVQPFSCRNRGEDENNMSKLLVSKVINDNNKLIEEQIKRDTSRLDNHENDKLKERIKKLYMWIWILLGLSALIIIILILNR